MKEKQKGRRRVPEGANRMPSESVFFDKIVPILLVTLGVVMVLLILVAAGFLLGVISF